MALGPDSNDSTHIAPARILELHTEVSVTPSNHIEFDTEPALSIPGNPCLAHRF